MELKLFARVRKLLEAIDIEGPGNDEGLVLNQQLELLVAQGAAQYNEIVRIGRAFYVNTVGTAVAAVVALPTTGHMLSLYNGQPDGGRTMIIDWITAINVASAATAANAVLIMNIGQIREAVPTDAALAIKKLNGLGVGTVDSSAKTILTGTALPAGTGVAAQWIAVPGQEPVAKPGAAATPGYGLFADLSGRVMVAPGRYFAMHVLASTVAETFQACIAWHEKQLVLG